MIDRQTSVRDIDWFNDLVAFERLDLSPPYQRYSVWSLGYKQYFIDTILSNFPCPSIFLHKDVVDGTGPIYRVVDGKQRLLSIFEFQAGRFRLSSDAGEFADFYWSDLSQEMRLQFGNYSIPVEILTTNSLQDLREAFDRLNRNVRGLNKQELRHARWDGPFIGLMESLARESFWKKAGVSTPARMRSMRDVEYVSEIFLLTAHGVQDGNYRVLDDYYAKYDDPSEYQEIETCRSRYDRCRDTLKGLGTDFLKATRFRNLHDLYSLWGALLGILPKAHINYEATRNELSEFHKRVADPDRIASDDQAARRYSDAVRQGQNKLGNRRIRADILTELIRTE